MGISIESSKTGTVDREFKFLGVSFDLSKGSMTYDGSTISIYEK